MSNDFESLKKQYSDLVGKSDNLSQQNLTLTLRLEEIERMLKGQQNQMEELKKLGEFAPGSGSAGRGSNAMQSLQTIGNPLGVQQFMTSQRTFNKELQDCKSRKVVDEYGRPVDINTLPYYTCPGDDADIAVQRENALSRFGYNQLQPFPSNVPKGLMM